jgi:uncharacterized membrane protein
MTQTHFNVTGEIDVPPQVVWSVIADVEHWPKWTVTVSRVKLLTPGPLQIGSRVRIHQPKLPAANWRVTELSSGRAFTLVSFAPGVRVAAQHSLEATATGCRVTLSISYEGVFGPWLARWTRTLNERYLAMEANGLKEYCMTLCNTALKEDLGRGNSPDGPGARAAGLAKGNLAAG